MIQVLERRGMAIARVKRNVWYGARPTWVSASVVRHMNKPTMSSCGPPQSLENDQTVLDERSGTSTAVSAGIDGTAAEPVQRTSGVRVCKVFWA